MKTLITLLILGLTAQNCIKGCLKCSSDGKCILCDTTSFYKTNADSCSQIEQPNCEMINLLGDCISCQDGYWLNSSTKKCVVVETEKIVTNCRSYSSTQTCRNCDAHFVIASAKCEGVQTQITNCEVYQSGSVCERCKSGYFVSFDGKSCIIVPSISNCDHLSRFKCDSCGGNFILNKNLYFKTSFKTGTNGEKLATLLNVLQKKNNVKTLQNNVQVCQETSSPNCLVYETFNTCKICAPNYFLLPSKSCQIYPKSIINNCSTYSSNTICTACNQGFYLLSSTECKAVTPVENCAEYTTTSNTSKCQKCNSEFYLSSSTSCPPRTISAGSLIANCKSKSYNSDKCGECNTGYILANTGDECVLALPECKTHNSFSKGVTPICLECNDLFYKLNGVCTSGNDANCVVYESNGTCDVCKDKWYHLGATSCVEHVDIANCGNYHNTIANTCEFCVNNTFNFEVQKRCKMLAEIPFCKTYDHGANNNVTAASCSECEDGYYLSGNTSCLTINIANCRTQDNSSVCTHCKDNYVLFDNGTAKQCILPHDYMIEQCETIEGTGIADDGSAYELNDVSCKNCKINALTLDYTNNYVCVLNDYLKDVFTIDLADAVLISDCIKYESKTECGMCIDGKYLKKDKSECLENCGTFPFFAFNVVDGSNDVHKMVANNNMCGAAAVDNVLMKAYDDEFTEIVVKCKPGKVTVVTAVLLTPVRTSNVNLEGSLGNWVKEIKDIKTSNPAVTCPTGATKINGNTPTEELVVNCDYYKLGSANEYGCVKCKHEFHGKSDSDGKFIEACTSMSSCRSGVTYGNLLGTFSQFFSCHQCTDENKIPFFVYKMASAPTVSIEFDSFDQYNFGSGNKYVDTGINDNNTIECLNFTSIASFRTDIGSTDTTITDIVAHCGLGLFDINIILKSAPFIAKCAACKPGYKPGVEANTGANPPVVEVIEPNSTDGTVTKCTKIDFCTNSEWFNACSSCDNNYVFEYASNKINYTKCIKQTDPNCFAAVSANKNCSLCKKGYVLNDDGECVVLNTPKCISGKYSQYMEVPDGSTENSGYLYWYSDQGAGCNQCDSGYTAFKYSAENFKAESCATSAFVSSNGTNFPVQKTNSTKSNYINHCESYVVGESKRSKCAKCNANYVLRDDGSECITLSNCETATNSGAFCKICKPGHALVNKLCADINIPNCSEYNTANSNITADCLTCNEGFYKTSTSTCEPGEVANCKKLGNSPEVCSECKEGYFKITKSQLSSTGNPHDYCYKMDESLNCKVATISNSDIGIKLTCTTCSLPYSIIEAPLTTEAQTTCFPYNQIENCETYNTNASLNTSTFLCKSCKTGFYLSQDGFKCLKRTITPIGCITFQKTADLCSICADEHFLSSDKKECIKFPSGVINCRTYSDPTTCTACNSDTWLNEGACTPIELTSKVTSCLYYSDAITCSTCQTGLFLEGNTCETLNISNCAKITNKDTCETCLPNNRLITENGKTTCEPHTKPNCMIYEQTGTNPCTQCNQNYYVNADGNCTAVTTVIAHCLVNASVDTCEVCESRYAVSVDEKSCVNASEVDSNCAAVSMFAGMSCAKCDAGYYFGETGCVKFQGKSFEEGCFSQDLDDEKVCLVCNSGFFMNSKMECVEDDPVVVVDPSDSDDSDDVVRRLVGLVFALLFLF